MASSGSALPFTKTSSLRHDNSSVQVDAITFDTISSLPQIPDATPGPTQTQYAPFHFTSSSSFLGAIPYAIEDNAMELPNVASSVDDDDFLLNQRPLRNRAIPSVLSRLSEFSNMLSTSGEPNTASNPVLALVQNIKNSSLGQQYSVGVVPEILCPLTSSSMVMQPVFDSFVMSDLDLTHTATIADDSLFRIPAPKQRVTAHTKNYQAIYQTFTDPATLMEMRRQHQQNLRSQTQTIPTTSPSVPVTESVEIGSSDGACFDSVLQQLESGAGDVAYIPAVSILAQTPESAAVDSSGLAEVEVVTDSDGEENEDMTVARSQRVLFMHQRPEDVFEHTLPVVSEVGLNSADDASRASVSTMESISNNWTPFVVKNSESDGSLLAQMHPLLLGIIQAQRSALVSRLTREAPQPTNGLVEVCPDIGQPNQTMVADVAKDCAMTGVLMMSNADYHAWRLKCDQQMRELSLLFPDSDQPAVVAINESVARGDLTTNTLCSSISESDQKILNTAHLEPISHLPVGDAGRDVKLSGLSEAQWTKVRALVHMNQQLNVALLFMHMLRVHQIEAGTPIWTPLLPKMPAVLLPAFEQMMAVRAFAVPQHPTEGLVPHHALGDGVVANNNLNALGGVFAELQNVPLVSDDLFNIPSFYFDQVLPSEPLSLLDADQPYARIPQVPHSHDAKWGVDSWQGTRQLRSPVSIAPVIELARKNATVISGINSVLTETNNDGLKRRAVAAVDIQSDGPNKSSTVAVTVSPAAQVVLPGKRHKRAHVRPAVVAAAAELSMEKPTLPRAPLSSDNRVLDDLGLPPAPMDLDLPRLNGAHLTSDNHLITSDTALISLSSLPSHLRDELAKYLSVGMSGTAVSENTFTPRQPPLRPMQIPSQLQMYRAVVSPMMTDSHTMRYPGPTATSPFPFSIRAIDLITPQKSPRIGTDRSAHGFDDIGMPAPYGYTMPLHVNRLLSSPMPLGLHDSPRMSSILAGGYDGAPTAHGALTLAGSPVFSTSTRSNALPPTLSRSAMMTALASGHVGVVGSRMSPMNMHDGRSSISPYYHTRMMAGLQAQCSHGNIDGPSSANFNGNNSTMSLYCASNASMLPILPTISPDVSASTGPHTGDPQPTESMVTLRKYA